MTIFTKSSGNLELDEIFIGLKIIKKILVEKFE